MVQGVCWLKEELRQDCLYYSKHLRCNRVGRFGEVGCVTLGHNDRASLLVWRFMVERKVRRGLAL